MKELELVDKYVKGKLNSEETDNLWAEMIRNPELIQKLEIEVMLQEYFSRPNPL